MNTELNNRQILPGLDMYVRDSEGSPLSMPWLSIHLKGEVTFMPDIPDLVATAAALRALADDVETLIPAKSIEAEVVPEDAPLVLREEDLGNPDLAASAEEPAAEVPDADAPEA